MKEIICDGCGSSDFKEINGYRICNYCGKKYLITQDDKPGKYSDISLNEDVRLLLKKWDEHPDQADKYANLILQIDPNNTRAKLHKANKATGGCYIATSVYGSYDCPQVWVLRRYRDLKLARSPYGRLFIKIYYAVSPKLVKLFGDNESIKSIWRSWLNKTVQELKEEGYADTRYSDYCG